MTDGLVPRLIQRATGHCSPRVRHVIGLWGMCFGEGLELGLGDGGGGGVEGVAVAVCQYLAGGWLVLLLQQLGPKLATLPPLSGDQPPVEQITGTTRRSTIWAIWGRRYTMSSVFPIGKQVAFIQNHNFEDPWPAEAPCCEIFMLSVKDPDLSLVRHLNLSGFSLTCPRQLLCFVATPNHSAQSPLHPWMTPHCLITGLESLVRNDTVTSKTESLPFARGAREGDNTKSVSSLSN